MFGFLKKRKNPQVSSLTNALRVPVRARYDAAQTSPDNAKHWSLADSLSADAAASPNVRDVIRKRARYEVSNNSYAKGIVLTLANDCVGTGPRLQMQTGNDLVNDAIETLFMEWAEEIGLAEKLLTARTAKVTDGEAILLLVRNDALKSPVKLDVQLVEPEQLTTPWEKIQLAQGQMIQVDGIEFDEWGNPSQYYILDQHPCGTSVQRMFEYKTYKPNSVCHWFRADRAGQHRGVSEITPALPLFANLRRYALAVIAAAETAADYAAVIYTDIPAGGEASEVKPMEVVELEKRSATVLPDGWKLGQVDAMQPTTTYSDYVKAVLNEIARCLNMPYNVAACNSSMYNYASGRLDHQTYFKSIRVEQKGCERVILNPIFRAWLDRAILISDYLPIQARALKSYAHQWFWDGREHIDPAKEAAAQAQRLTSNTTTLAEEYAKAGKDWQKELDQRAKEKAYMKKIGLTENEAMPVPNTKSNKNEKDEENAE
jgi:lambda family phage portal protein